MTETNTKCCKGGNMPLVYNRKMSLAMGITSMVVIVCLVACSIAEFCIGAFPSRGMAIGMVFFNGSSAIYALVAWKHTIRRYVNCVFGSCAFAVILNFLFHIGQIVRIIYIVGYKSVGRDQDIDDPEAVAIVMYTELCLLNVVMACMAVLTVIGGQAVLGGSQVAQEAGEKPQ